MQKDPGEKQSWNDVMRNVSSRGDNDWRMPNAQELQNIADNTNSLDITNSAAIDPVFNTTAIKDADGNINYPFLD